MGHQIIAQPDGRLAVYSSTVDSWIIVDATPAEILDYYAGKAADAARRDTQQQLDAVAAGTPRRAYFQFARTFTEANESSRDHGGAYWADGGWRNFRPAREREGSP